MKGFSSAIFLTAILACCECQIHYVPAQVLIPTINGTHILATNHSSFNNSYKPPILYNNPPTYVNNRPTTYNNSGNSSLHNNGSADGHLLVGNIQTFDRLLFNQEYFKDSRWWTNREKIIEYPKDVPAGYARHETISAIRIYNKFYHGNSARAYILKGGVGSQYVKIKLVSKTNHGFKYLVQMFGH